MSQIVQKKVAVVAMAKFEADAAMESLRARGVAVECLTCCHELHQWLEGRRPDVVLCGEKLPDGNWIRVLELTHRYAPNAPLLVNTANGWSGVWKRGVAWTLDPTHVRGTLDAVLDAVPGMPPRRRAAHTAPSG